MSAPATESTADRRGGARAATSAAWPGHCRPLLQKHVTCFCSMLLGWDYFEAASKRVFTSFQFTTFHQLVAYSPRLFWYLR